MMTGLTVYGFETEIEELLDEACNELDPADYKKLLADVARMLDERVDC